MKFSDIIGQQAVKEHLQNAIRENKISHSYMLSGAEGMGKKMMAEAFAAALLCEDRGENADSCGLCHSCRQAQTHNHPDIRYVVHDKPNLISVEEIRDQLVGDVMIRPYQSAHKVYIVENAQMMNTQAQNAILKTIEEPPEYAVIFLLVTNEEMMLPTIRSRCLKLAMDPVSDDLIRDYLGKVEHIPSYRVNSILSFAQGNLGKAIAIAGSDDFSDRRDFVIQMMTDLPDSHSYNWQDWEDIILKDKKEMSDYLDMMEDWYRDVLLFKSGCTKDQMIFSDAVKSVERAARKLSYEKGDRLLREIHRARIKLKSNVSPELVFENLFAAASDR